jgi:6-phosphogluconate dehydrogenase
MKLGMIGLGRMGGNMVRRLESDGHELVTYTRSGGGTAGTIEELVSELEPPRVAWMMVPAGEATEATLTTLLGSLEPDDIVVDGGNSNFRDSNRGCGSAGERQRNEDASDAQCPPSRAPGDRHCGVASCVREARREHARLSGP